VAASARLAVVLTRVRMSGPFRGPVSGRTAGSRDDETPGAVALGGGCRAENPGSAP
jgi:hypothetical protein